MKYKAYTSTGHTRAHLMMGKRYLPVLPGYLNGPVTVFWHTNGKMAALLPHLLKTSYNQSFTRKEVMRPCGQKYRQTIWPQVTTYNLAKFGDGGYPLTYITKDGGCLCAGCATEQMVTRDIGWPPIIGVDAYYEGPPVNCEHCNVEIESAYGDPDAA